ncbi:MAG: hypothetical protein J0653_07645, partial [Deltaproteobacteria bacterium]|nr:hypothetical protein [Deltaproteobacteria bacterium]
NPYTVVNGLDGGFTYKNTLASFGFIDQIVDANLTNANPLFNKITGYLSYAPDVSFEFNSSGDGKYSFKWDDLEAGKFLE